MTIPEEYGTGIVDVGAGKVWRGSGGRQQQVAPYEAWTGLDRLAARGGRRLAHLSRTSETLRKARHQAGLISSHASSGYAHSISTQAYRLYADSASD